jgi:predicted secreted acid phosphatase
VLDIDETSLSNFPQLLANDFRYIPTGRCLIDQGGTCGDLAWELEMRAGAVAPTLALFNAAKARGVAVFFITGRYDEPALRRATARNLRRAGYYGWTALIMRGPNEREGISAFAFKTNRRRLIEAEGYTVIATVGDQWSDVDGGYAERKYKLPNPFYFIP